MSEKQQNEQQEPLLPRQASPKPPPPPSKKLKKALLLLIPALLLWQVYNLALPTCLKGQSDDDNNRVYTAEEVADAKCPVQPPPLSKGAYWNPIDDPIFSELAAKRLSKAVQIDTQSYDTLPANASDPAFDKHYKFSHFLENEFAKLFASPVEHEYVNTHGHLFTWPGSNPDLEPILLMAHIDTVPVLEDTRDLWTFPPFEGTISVNATKDTPGTWIWGRGSSDCKNSLIGIYSAVERLVSEGFKPERTILIANGFDEEIGGTRGALALSHRIQEKYDSLAFLIDEGFSGLEETYGTKVASFGMAEKGAFNTQIKVETPGGHSSVPPPHTAIGILSLLLAELEAHPFKPTLDPRGPYIKYLSCLADYAPDFPKDLKKAVNHPASWNRLARKLASEDRIKAAFLGTTQAIDIIRGGLKVNALPEVVEAVVNHRVSFTEGIEESLDHLEKVLLPIAEEYNFTVSAFDGSEKSSSRHITLSLAGDGYFPSAPITSPKDPSFGFLAGTTKAVFGEDVVVAPTGMFANTDTRHFWNLTHNLYRFTPAYVVGSINQHTVDERTSLEAHLNTTRFYYQLIQNTAGWHP